ncbi:MULTISPECIES: HNH endonuclease signature motif containing protein [Achromobacter]|uniref:HNH endonuclease signature motif containing protein n=1 Tax=Achromobacter TaxID=222 RepID=UPI00244A64B9|nr:MULTISPECIES: HNH endonuclease signature motif containing protein [Achromobacter]MDH1299682.1 HNH endonuclease [Achromobacter sp. GD03932]WLW64305.1 HNH endonuclease signature motif containing protein [Achromobacter aegrifaciens]
MPSKETITQEALKCLLDYCPDTGVFRWKEKVSRRVVVGSPAGTVSKKGYVRIIIRGRNYAAHRLAFLYMQGAWPEDQVDHINRVTSDNRWANLRPVSNRQNQFNKGIVEGVLRRTGVLWNKQKRKWRASIRSDRVLKHLGYFDDFDLAVKARVSAEHKYFAIG